MRPTHSLLTAALLGAGVSVLAATKAMADDRDRALDRLMDVRGNYYTAEGDPDISRYAGRELGQARLSLTKAERLWDERADAHRIEKHASRANEIIEAARKSSAIETARVNAEKRILEAEKRAEDAAFRAKWEAEQAEAARFETPGWTQWQQEYKALGRKERAALMESLRKRQTEEP
jgi:hypothetical protein